MEFNPATSQLVGTGGTLLVEENDEVARKLAMLIEGECEGLGPTKAAQKFGLTKQRYFQIRKAFLAEGSHVLLSKRRGPTVNYRRTSELVRQVIRHRFLDPDATVEVIAQRLRQAGFTISVRSVERVIADYGLQKTSSPGNLGLAARLDQSTRLPCGTATGHANGS